MNEALAAWVEKLDNSCLPTLQANTERLKQLATDENADVGELAALIESDPALTLRLMRYINSLSHKHLRSEVTTVRHALMMLGLSHVQQIPQNIIPIEALDEAARTRLLRHFNRSLHAAYQARDWGRMQHDMLSDELYMAALLHNLGEMLLDYNAPQEMDRVREMIQTEKMNPDEAEYIVFGFSIDSLTRELAKHWSLPSIIIDSLKSENAQHNRVLTVMLASELARSCEQGWHTPRTLSLLEQIADLLLADVASVATLVHRNAVESARYNHHLGVPHPAMTLVQPLQPEEREDEESSQQSAEAEEGAELCLLPQRKVLLDVMKRLAHADESMPLKEVIRLAMEGMHEGLGLNRVVFAVLTPDKGQLRARSIVGSNKDPQFNRFVIDLVSHNLFVRLMEKPLSLWLNEGNRGKFFPLIPVQFHKMTRQDSFFVMSLFVRNKPVGMFYADRHSSSCELDAETYKHFKHLVAQVSHTLSRIVK